MSVATATALRLQAAIAEQARRALLQELAVEALRRVCSDNPHAGLTVSPDGASGHVEHSLE